MSEEYPTPPEESEQAATPADSPVAEVETPVPASFPRVPYVPWIGRVAAYTIDALPAIFVAIVSSIYTATTGTTSNVTVARINGHDITAQTTDLSPMGTAVQVLATVLILAYWFWNKGYREGTTGKSIGKQALGFTTVDEASGQPLGAKTGCLRVVLLWVDFLICYVGVLWPLWDVKKQTLLSDRFTNAIVIKD